MRPYLLAFAAFLLCLGCVQKASSGAGGGDAAAPVCDGKKSCSACTTCAQQVQCASLGTACNANAGCVGLDQCYGTCGTDTGCRAQCDLANPSGAADYDALTRCIDCTECPSDCAGYRTCN